MSGLIAGTFITTSAPASLGQISGPLQVPTGVTSMNINVDGLDASNTVKTQKRVAGGAWADQVTYNANTNTNVAVAAGEEWRLVQVTQQAIRDVRYVLTAR